MKLNDWLQTPGRKAALARHLGVHPTMVSQMVGGKKPIRVPPKHYRAIRDFTDGVVTLEDLLPEHVSPPAEQEAQIHSPS